MLEEIEVMLEEMEVMLEEMEVMLEEMEVVKVFVGAYSVVGKRLESERLESDQVRQLVQSPDEDRRCPAFLQEQTPLFC